MAMKSKMNGSLYVNGNDPVSPFTLNRIVKLHSLASYTFGTKDAAQNLDEKSFEKLKIDFENTGTQRSVECVLLVHEHGLPHVLFLQLEPNIFRLPGGNLTQGEEEAVGLTRLLNEGLCKEEGKKPDWFIEDLIGNWWRPNFNSAVYPYLPPHVCKPKEHKRIFLVKLPHKALFAVPKNYKLVAAPFCEIYDNSVIYGPIISSLPQVLSRFNFIFE